MKRLPIFNIANYESNTKLIMAEFDFTFRKLGKKNLVRESYIKEVADLIETFIAKPNYIKNYHQKTLLMLLSLNILITNYIEDQNHLENIISSFLLMLNQFVVRPYNTWTITADLIYYISDSLCILLSFIDEFDSQINFDQLINCLSCCLKSIEVNNVKHLFIDKIINLIGKSCEKTSLLTPSINSSSFILDIVITKILESKEGILENKNYVMIVLKEAEFGLNLHTPKKFQTEYSIRDLNDKNNSLRASKQKAVELLKVLYPAMETLCKYLIKFTSDLSIGQKLWQSVKELVKSKAYENEEADCIDFIIKYIFSKNLKIETESHLKSTYQKYVSNNEKENQLKGYEFVDNLKDCKLISLAILMDEEKLKVIINKHIITN